MHKWFPLSIIGTGFLYRSFFKLTFLNSVVLIRSKGIFYTTLYHKRFEILSIMNALDFPGFESTSTSLGATPYASSCQHFFITENDTNTGISSGLLPISSSFLWAYLYIVSPATFKAF